MSADWKEQYKKSRAWKYNIGLVNGDDGTKICEACEEKKYTIDFPDASEFDDHKLPVCISCFKGHDEEGRRIVSEYHAYRKCRQCQDRFTLDHFAYRKNGNKLSDTCRDCVGTYEFQKDGGK